jgi:hypothetical protein
MVSFNANAVGKTVVGVGRCPDPSSPDGYGAEIVSEPTTPIAYPPDGSITEAGYVLRPPGGNPVYVIATQEQFFPPTDAFNTNAATVKVTLERRFYANRPWPGTTGWTYTIIGYDSANNFTVGYSMFRNAIAFGEPLFDGPAPDTLTLTSIKFFSVVGSDTIELPLQQ